MVQISFSEIFAFVIGTINVIVIPWAIYVNRRMSKHATDIEVMKVQFMGLIKLEATVEKMEKEIKNDFKEMRNQMAQLSNDMQRIPQQLATIVKDLKQS